MVELEQRNGMWRVSRWCESAAEAMDAALALEAMPVASAWLPNQDNGNPLVEPKQDYGNPIGALAVEEEQTPEIKPLEPRLDGINPPEGELIAHDVAARYQAHCKTGNCED